MSDQDSLNTEMDDEKTYHFDASRQMEESRGEEEETPPSTRPRVIVTKGEETILEVVIDDLPVDIGRKSDNHIVLEEKNVSRKHAQIIMKEEQYFIMDSGSAGGTKLNGEKVSEKDIHTGDAIEIGDYKLRFDSGLPDDERTVFETDEETVLEEATTLDEDRTMFYEEQEAKLIVIKSEILEGEITLEEDEVTMGRDDSVDISIADKRLSREHCKISRDGNDFIISDLGSSNGSFVNGQKVQQKTLENGDKIQVGSNVFEFRFQKTAAPRRRSRVGILIKAAAGLAALFVLCLAADRFLLRPGRREPHKVIMQKLWEHPTSAAVAISPGLGDLNGDGYIDLVAADRNGVIYGLDGRQGGLIWNSEFRSGGGAILSSPLLVDINEKDGKLDVVIGTTTRGVLAIDGGTMRQIWSGRVGSAVNSSSAATDINGDGTDDVFIGTARGKVICLDGRQGGAVWTFSAGAPIKTAPVLVDINGDDIPDVIIGSTNARIYALNGKDGTNIWGYSGSGEPSTVACSDFDRDRIPDIAVVTPSALIVLEGQKGSVLWKWSVPTSARPTQADPFLPFPPAISDLNGDKIPDVILSAPRGHVYAIDGASKGSKYIWDYGLTSVRKTGPALCDLNGDGTSDVVVGDNNGNLIVIDGKTGHQLNKLKVGGSIILTPSLGDFTSTGLVSIAAGTGDKKIITVQTETKIKKNRIVWDSFGGNKRNTGNVPK